MRLTHSSFKQNREATACVHDYSQREKLLICSWQPSSPLLESFKVLLWLEKENEYVQSTTWPLSFAFEIQYTWPGFLTLRHKSLGWILHIGHTIYTILELASRILQSGIVIELVSLWVIWVRFGTLIRGNFGNRYNVNLGLGLESIWDLNGNCLWWLVSILDPNYGYTRSSCSSIWLGVKTKRVGFEPNWS